MTELDLLAARADALLQALDRIVVPNDPLGHALMDAADELDAALIVVGARPADELLAQRVADVRASDRKDSSQ